MFNAYGRTVGYPSAVVCTQMVSHLPVCMYLYLVSSVLLFQHHEDNPTCLKYSATHNALHSSLYWNYKPSKRKCSNMRRRGESKNDVLSCQCPEAHSL